MGSCVSAESFDETRASSSSSSASSELWALFWPVKRDLEPLAKSVARRIAPYEKSSVRDRALCLALIARFRFGAPKDISSMLYRCVLVAEQDTFQGVCDFGGSSSEPPLNIVLVRGLLSESRKWVHLLECVSLIVIFVDASRFDAETDDVCDCCDGNYLQVTFCGMFY